MAIWTPPDYPAMLAEEQAKVREWRTLAEDAQTTLRDQMAMSCPDTFASFKREREMNLTTYKAEIEAFCRYRYEYADAMIRARNTTGEE